MQINALTPHLGAEITQVDSKDPSCHKDLLAALSQYGVIVLRNQQLTPEQQIAMAKGFGEINVNRFFKAAQVAPQEVQAHLRARLARGRGALWSRLTRAPARQRLATPLERLARLFPSVTPDDVVRLAHR